MENKDAEMPEDVKIQEVVEDAGVEFTDEQDLKPIDTSSQSLSEFVDQTVSHLKSENWKLHFNGFDDLRRLYKYHPETFKENIPKFRDLVVNNGVENLRSSICRNALNLVVEVFEKRKELSEKNENGEITPYAQFAHELLSPVGKKVADDKTFLSSRAKQAIELMSKSCFDKETADILCALSDSKSLIIGA